MLERHSKVQSRIFTPEKAYSGPPKLTVDHMKECYSRGVIVGRLKLSDRKSGLSPTAVSEMSPGKKRFLLDLTGNQPTRGSFMP